ncbi:MAG TPA: phage repressor protein [Lachnospiraceae bacterium]|uniref:Cro/C1-type helix-turn-helix DNA-binding protein n=1 Tax=Muricomes intestini TaxID=1796634 RepID=A0A4R3K6R8_9FIRM|nr:transcriptional regulator [Muricomes intestini]TCS78497.1 Cro/C1-type helix-turn-helix DNA-binding protein [Muricomes intestini]HCR83896.1 phage repressor protein [Lachnospiraceae bacterium]
MVNINRLRGKMVENGITVDELAEIMGIDRATLYRRLNSQGKEFSIKEADTIVKALKLGKEEASNIFFSQFVA